ncbi:MAG: type II toxin-antitoxin system RelE/ParE family toxin [Gammaproteobacteria bacterium]|nr:type II toxin-antitoxin system RelE/ParE family toxin [Gammaproteobacteria bacterium]
MIRSWRHKGLKNLFEKGDCSGINVSHLHRLKIILQRLNAATTANDMNTPGMRLHKLTGKLKNHYSVTVNKNWRVIFMFDGQDAILVDYLDYH